MMETKPSEKQQSDDEETVTLPNLPNDIIEKICSYLPSESLVRFSRVFNDLHLFWSPSFIQKHAKNMSNKPLLLLHNRRDYCSFSTLDLLSNFHTTNNNSIITPSSWSPSSSSPSPSSSILLTSPIKVPSRISKTLYTEIVSCKTNKRRRQWFEFETPMLETTMIVGSCYGLVCVGVRRVIKYPDYCLTTCHCRCLDFGFATCDMHIGCSWITDLILWNPAKEDYYLLPDPKEGLFSGSPRIFGFGYDTVNHTFKVVMAEASPSITQVYDLITGSWEEWKNVDWLEFEAELHNIYHLQEFHDLRRQRRGECGQYVNDLRRNQF